jgi:hypothetical protein
MERILELASTYQAQIDFRNRVLRNTPLGERVIGLYEESLPDIWEVARRRYDLVDWSRKMLLKYRPLVVEIVRLAESSDDAAGEPGPQRLSSEDYAEVEAAANEFRRETASEGFRRAIDDVLAELRGFVGLNAVEVLDRLATAPGLR